MSSSPRPAASSTSRRPSVRGRGERLVDDDGEPRVEGGQGDGPMGPVGGGDHRQLEVEARRRPQLVGVANNVARGWAAAARRRRSGSDVTMAARSSPATASMNGAWKVSPANP